MDLEAVIEVEDPIHCARTGNAEFFSRVALSVILESRSSNDESVLSVASKENQLVCCQEIYKRCPSLLYHQDEYGNTALHHAVQGGFFEIVRFLLNAGGSDRVVRDEVSQLLKLKNLKGETALHLSVRYGHLQITKYLIEADPNRYLIKEVNEDNNTAMHLAVQAHNVPTVKLLIEADPEFEYSANNSGDTPLQIAIRNALSSEPGDVHLQNYLLIAQPTSCKRKTGENEWTILHYAAFIGAISAIDEILRVYPDCMDLVDLEGRNFLHVATMSGHFEVIRYTLQIRDISSSILNGRDHYGRTPLHYAALHQDTSVILPLLYDPRVNKVTMDEEGKTALDLISFEYDTRKARGMPKKLGFVTGDQKELKEQKNFDLIVCALIATVSFTAGIVVPGGYMNEGTNEGTAVLSKQISFKVFVVANTLALMFSLYTIFSSFSTRTLLQKDQIFYDEKVEEFRTRLLIKSYDIIFQLNVSTVCTLTAIYSLVIAFLTGSYAVFGNSHGLAITVSALCGCFLISAFVTTGIRGWNYFKTPGFRASNSFRTPSFGSF